MMSVDLIGTLENVLYLVYPLCIITLSNLTSRMIKLLSPTTHMPRALHVLATPSHTYVGYYSTLSSFPADSLPSNKGKSCVLASILKGQILCLGLVGECSNFDVFHIPILLRCCWYGG